MPQETTDLVTEEAVDYEARCNELEQQLKNAQYTNEYLRKTLDRKNSYFQAALTNAAEALESAKNTLTLLRLGGEQ